ncbi:MAG: helix-hairpin-helix domain-containing protein [Candidatus Omnitrophota bacterium]
MKRYYNRKGIALILVVGILTVFTVTLTAFALNMQLERTATGNYANTVRARYYAEAGVDYVLAVLRNNFKTTVADSQNERWASPYTLTMPGGTVVVTIGDEQAKVNINNANLLLLSNIPSLGATLAQSIVDYRTNTRTFSTKEEVKLVPGIGTATYDAIKDIITVSSYIDPGRGNRSPVNINTADPAVITALLSGISDGTVTINALEAQNLTNELVVARPFNSWAAFNNAIDNSASITSAQKQMLKTLLNPLSRWPSPAPSAFTTEFCIYSGCFSLTSQSTVRNRANNPVAYSNVQAIISLFSSTNDSTFITTLKEDFRGEDANYDGILDAGEDTNGNGILDVPDYDKVTWMDSCPLNSSDDSGLTYASGYGTIPDSLKIGFWDNFDEDEDYSRSEWIRREAAADYSIGNDTNAPAPDPDNELLTGGSYPAIDLMDVSKWDFSDFSIRAYVCDPDIPEASDPNVAGRGWEDVAHLNFRRRSMNEVYDNYVSCRGMMYVEYPEGSGNWVPYPPPPLGPPYMIFQPIHFLRLGPVEHRIDPYPPFYDREKTYKLIVRGSNVDSYVYYNNGGYNLPVLSCNDATRSSGRIGIIGAWMFFPAWDDIRIISTRGSYTSTSFNTERQVEWGTISGTVAIPSTASPLSEMVSFQTSVDGGVTFASPSASGAISASPSQTIQYRANLSTANINLSETPILEDVVVTYLKPNTAKTVYYKYQSE